MERLQEALTYFDSPDQAAAVLEYVAQLRDGMITETEMVRKIKEVAKFE